MPPLTQTPWPLHPLGQAGMLHAGPPHPRWHAQRPRRHSPRPLQWAGHVSSSHAMPVQPSVQTHVPDTQRPRPSSAWHPSGLPAGSWPRQVSIMQSGGCQPMSHRHVPKAQVACPAHSIDSHASTEQSDDVHPTSHSHRSGTERGLPWPEHTGCTTNSGCCTGTPTAGWNSGDKIESRKGTRPILIAFDIGRSNHRIGLRAGTTDDRGLIETDAGRHTW